MAYKIAVASSDGQQVDLHFGHAERFHIYEVQTDGKYDLLEIRQISNAEKEDTSGKQNEADTKQNEAGCNKSGGIERSAGCNRGDGIERSSARCNNEHRGHGGCGGGHSDEGIESRITLIKDCRCLLCSAIGPGAERRLERSAITVFGVEVPIESAMKKIIGYYHKTDHHQSLLNDRV